MLINLNATYKFLISQLINELLYPLHPFSDDYYF